MTTRTHKRTTSERTPFEGELRALKRIEKELPNVDPETRRDAAKVLFASETELEALWRKNKQRRYHNRQVPKFCNRPATFRGPAFVHELMRCRVITNDQRFEDALSALFDHDIIDDNFNFKRWNIDADLDARTDRKLLELICMLIEEDGQSIRRACAQAVAMFGIKAASFKAAIKQAQMLHASSTAKKAAAR